MGVAYIKLRTYGAIKRCKVANAEGGERRQQMTDVRSKKRPLGGDGCKMEGRGMCKRVRYENKAMKVKWKAVTRFLKSVRNCREGVR